MFSKSIAVISAVIALKRLPDFREAAKLHDAQKRSPTSTNSGIPGTASFEYAAQLDIYSGQSHKMYSSRTYSRGGGVSPS